MTHVNVRENMLFCLSGPKKLQKNKTIMINSIITNVLPDHDVTQSVSPTTIIHSQNGGWALRPGCAALSPCPARLPPPSRLSQQQSPLPPQRDQPFIVLLLLLSTRDCAKSLVSQAGTVSRVHVSSQSGGWRTDGSAAGPQPRQAGRRERREGGTEGRERLDALSKSGRELAVSARTCFIL